MRRNKELRGKGLGIATAYDFENEPSSMIHEQLARLKFAESKINFSGKRIIDYGCGTGYNSYYITKRQSPREVVGLDIQEECIAYCKKYYATKLTEFYVQDCLSYNPKFGLFDVGISSEVIEHVNDQKSFLESFVKYLQPNGIALISTPNKGLFSLCKDKSFINHSHVKELFFDQFNELISNSFLKYKIYSQIHKSYWHSAFINYLCASNLIHAFRYEIFGDNIIGKITSQIVKYFLYAPIFVIRSKSYPDVRKRKHGDFEFVEDYDNHAIWFVAICSNPI